MGSPAVVIGVPLYGQAELLPSALGSLLGQTYEDVAFVLVDDASQDGTAEVAGELIRDDPRAELVVNGERIGMLANTNRAYALARERHPGARYWALGSDHDLWEPAWLARLVAALDARPSAVLAYPLTERIDGDGRVVSGSWRFATEGLLDPRERLRRSLRRMVSGDMIYGLFRTAALPPDRLYRPVLAPDRLALSELSLAGEFVQVPEVLWRRRFVGLASLDRQRRSFWPDGDVPASAHVPWWMVHTGVAARELGPALAARDYLPSSVAFQVRSRALRARDRAVVQPVKRWMTSPSGRRITRERVLPAVRETRDVLERLADEAEARR